MSNKTEQPLVYAYPDGNGTHYFLVATLNGKHQFECEFVPPQDTGWTPNVIPVDELPIGILERVKIMSVFPRNREYNFI